MSGHERNGAGEGESKSIFESAAEAVGLALGSIAKKVGIKAERAAAPAEKSAPKKKAASKKPAAKKKAAKKNAPQKAAKKSASKGASARKRR